MKISHLSIPQDAPPKLPVGSTVAYHNLGSQCYNGLGVKVGKGIVEVLMKFDFDEADKKSDTQRVNLTAIGFNMMVVVSSMIPIKYWPF